MRRYTFGYINCTLFFLNKFGMSYVFPFLLSLIICKLRKSATKEISQNILF